MIAKIVHYLQWTGEAYPLYYICDGRNDDDSYQDREDLSFYFALANEG